MSNIGSWTQRIAQDWLVLSVSGSATAVGITTALQFLPTLLFGPVGGAIADRFAKRAILVVTQSIMGLTAATMCVVALTGSLQVVEIFLLAFVLGLATAVDNPTRQAFVHEMVGPAQLRNAVSLNAASFQLGGLLGPALSGVLIGTVGTPAAFGVNALTFCGSLFGLSRIDSAHLHRTPRDHRPRPGIVGVVTAMRHRPQMWWPMVLAAVMSLFTTSFPTTLASYAAGVFQSGVGGFALLTGSLAVGSLVGSLLAARMTTVRLRGVVAAAAGLALTQLLAALAPNMVALALALLAVGCAAMLLGVSANSTVQLAADSETRGTVMGIYLLAVVGAGCLGGPLVGAINQFLSPRAGLALGGLVLGLVVLQVGRKLAGVAGIDPIPATKQRAAMAWSGACATSRACARATSARLHRHPYPRLGAVRAHLSHGAERAIRRPPRRPPPGNRQQLPGRPAPR